MRKIWVLTLVLVCSFATAVSAHGPGPDRRDHGRGPGMNDRRPEFKEHRDDREKDHAREVLGQTNDTLERAQRAARRGGYRDGLGRAFAHQDEARELYRQGSYGRAISHSMRAREIAEDIIRINQRRDRRSYHHDYDRRDDLDNSINLRIRDDKAALNLRIKLD